ncbi:LysR substrate-binding domain-containing protein [Marinicella litoralis]|uniref:LysR family cys regulon transcriptional activator n=1 Tax=Marinicella litoralis TaxID=644220 RepID=A0A4R6XGR7_9GAMM|nr:LysR substrate-binding domain-containing protein [Marinicella litoralis]TDR17479.1 LysR family cys regulon transcriptional activator [Marinicella litoralis]
MKLQQLRFFVSVCHSGLNVTAAAKQLYTSQPGVSRQVRLLEDELGFSLFVRQGKSLVALTHAGKEVLHRAERVLKEVENIKAFSHELTNQNNGHLNIATTHTQARYVLPPVLKQLHEIYPSIKVNLLQGTSQQNLKSLHEGEVDFVISSGNTQAASDLVKLDLFKWQRKIVVPKGHTLAKKTTISLQELAEHPLIVYVGNDKESSSLVQAFNAESLNYKIVFTARDSDVIKTYVRSGLGVGIIASMAVDEKVDDDLHALDTVGILPLSATWLAFNPSLFLRGFMHEFIQLFAPHVKREQVQSAIDNKLLLSDPQKVSRPIDSAWHS